MAILGMGVGSSFRIVPEAVAWVMLPLTGLEIVTVNPSSGSKSVSPLTLTVIVCGTEEPGGKATVPEGKTPPAKSAALAGLAPEPVTAQLTEDAFE